MAAWEKIRRLVLQRDHRVCAYCCDDADEVDHIVPVCQGGMNSDENLTASCKRCNRTKGGLTPWQWAARDKFALPPWWDQ